MKLFPCFVHRLARRLLVKPPVSFSIGSIVTVAFAFSASASPAESTMDKTTKENQLVGRAVLPAATFAPGFTSGRQLGAAPINGQSVPFVDKQPVQGFSAVLPDGYGAFLAMPDNGYGSMENSADFYLRVYRIKPDFETKNGGTGKIEVLDFIELKDPDHKVPFTITEHFTTDRYLTGADFDIESMQRAADGTLWFGDEFGPFLLHTDASGKVLEAPIPLPDFDHPGQQIRAPQNPFSEESNAVRAMNALRHHARINGGSKTPVFSPWYPLLDDGNPATGVDHRLAPPAGSGLTPAASDIFNITSLHNAGYPIVTWTVDDVPTMTALLALKVDGIISDRPDLLYAAVKAFDANNDGVPGDFLTSDGLIDPTKFDAQGHRGGRNLRPENTLPAFEVALDNLMTTLETDCGVTSDGIAILSHDPYIAAQKNRRADGLPYTEADEVLIKDLTAVDIQTRFIADKVFRGPQQLNDPALSPVSLAFFGLTAASPNAATIYRHPRLTELFGFVAYYQQYYTSGPGAAHPDAAKRAKNAGRVRFNIETKLNPRGDTDEKGIVFTSRTFAPQVFVNAIAPTIVAAGLQDRADIQSFDFRSLLLVHSQFPQIRTVALFGDFPKFANPAIAGSDDGTNLQPQGGDSTPWLAGLPWPYRQTVQSNPFRAKTSGGFEGMALTPDGRTLLPLLEKSLTGDDPSTLRIHAFDLSTRQYTGERYRYVRDPRGTSIGDFQLFDRNKGVVIERDDSMGNLAGFKAIFEIEFGAPNTAVTKTLAVDLMHLRDPDGISLPVGSGDVGLGDPFAMPFVTIEDLMVFDREHIGVINDNNYPFSVGRHAGSGHPDDTEFVLIKLARPLSSKPTQ
jgi:glycerophosphoryl diester phosphodiesterase